MATPLTDAIEALTTYANETTGASDTTLSDAVATLVDGYGGGGGSISYTTGTFTLENNKAITTSGTTLDIGLTSQPDMLYVWIDYDSFLSCAQENNRWYEFLLCKNDQAILETMPPIRISNTESAQVFFENAEWTCSVGTATSTCSDTFATTGKGFTGIGLITRNAGINSISSSGIITIASNSSGTQYLYAGTYHYVAVTGFSFVTVP